MSDHVVVCPADRDLLARLQHRAVVVRTGTARDIPFIAGETSANHKLITILLEFDGPLTACTVEPEWRQTPVTLYCRSVGPPRALMDLLAALRSHNVRVFVPGENADDFTGLRMLSSLGISCGILLRRESADWERANDLMHYAVYSRAAHAPIEPFHSVVNAYEYRKVTHLAAVYFNHPSKYLHMNERREIALTHEELMNGEIVATGIDALDSVPDMPVYKARSREWQDVFLEDRPCASCEAWRVCGGAYAPLTPHRNGCEIFFTDLMEAAEFMRKERDLLRGTSWQ